MEGLLREGSSIASGRLSCESFRCSLSVAYRVGNAEDLLHYEIGGREHLNDTAATTTTTDLRLPARPTKTFHQILILFVLCHCTDIYSYRF